MFDLDKMNAADLATCVEEYIKRAIATAREYEGLEKETVHLSISTSQYNSEAEFTIKHEARVGDNYGTGQYAQTSTNNLIEGVESCAHRLSMDKGKQPNVIGPLLPAPTPPVYDDEQVATDNVVDVDFEPIAEEEIVSGDTDQPTSAND